MDNAQQSLFNNKRKNQTQAERLSKIQVKVSEESRMKVIFNELCVLRKY